MGKDRDEEIERNGSKSIYVGQKESLEKLTNFN